MAVFFKPRSTHSTNAQDPLTYGVSKMSESDPKSKIFRKVALDRLSSPEQLDTLMRVITPKAWLALCPLLMLILGGTVWGWFGSLPDKILAT